MKLNKNLVIGLGIVSIIMMALQVPNWGQFSDPDGFYHAKASQLLANGELQDTFPWLTFTTWKDSYADQHYLYHTILIPFNTVELLQVSVILFALIFAAAFYLLLGEFKIKGQLWWTTLMFLGSTDFLFRINLVKANTLSLALICSLLFLTMRWYEKKNYLYAIVISIISFLFVWTYGGFVFVPVFLGLYTLAVLIIQRKFDIIPVLSSIVGIGLGLFLHPHSNHLLPLLYDQIFLTGLGAGSQVPAGNEWLAFNIDWFVKSNAPLLLAWLPSLIIAGYGLVKKNITWSSLWIHSIALVMLILTLWHRRFVEYFVPFAVLASVLTIFPYFAKLKWVQLKEAFFNQWQVGLAASLAIIILGSGALYNFDTVRKYLNNGEHAYKFRQAADAIRVDSQAGDIVINTQWDQFPQLFYWNNQNYYPVGLDPTFMYIYDPDKYWLWRNITDDEPEQWGSISDLHNKIKVNLGGDYLIVDLERNPSLWEFIEDNDPSFTFFQKLFDKNGIVVLKIN